MVGEAGWAGRDRLQTKRPWTLPVPGHGKPSEPGHFRPPQTVAQGRSNPDVAGRLLLSRRTVETHVSHILAKLQARSRREIADLAEGYARTDQVRAGEPLHRVRG